MPKSISMYKFMYVFGLVISMMEISLNVAKVEDAPNPNQD